MSQIFFFQFCRLRFEGGLKGRFNAPWILQLVSLIVVVVVEVYEGHFFISEMISDNLKTGILGNEKGT